jgi:SAM-dependent methyltransferase
MDRLDRIVGAMAATALSPQAQRVQTRFRLDLVDTWNIRPGDSVLEIGCGQGDTTAVLADAVGAHGSVLGVDTAPQDFGAPVTLAESAAQLARSPLGKQITMRFEFDVLDHCFPADSFDHVVMSHCSWYFASLGRLRQTLRHVRPWARQLCFAEWDLQMDRREQLPHLLAVLTQGHVEAAGSRGSGNVRTPHSRQTALRVISDAGWEPVTQRTLDTAGLPDADWEIDACFRILAMPSRMQGIPEPVAELIKSQADALRVIGGRRGNATLPSYSVTAPRAASGEPENHE